VSFEADLKSFGISLGFSRVGIAAATDADSFPVYEAWLDDGMHGEMAYLERRRAERQHPRSILTSVRSVIMVAMEYGSLDDGHDRIPIHHGRVARYAQGPDYHRLMWDTLAELQSWMTTHRVCETAAVTDTAPLLERDFARRAGLGWVGKNTMLIDPKRGSFSFLGALVTNLDLKSDPSFDVNHCGTCTACLDACPTDAFPKPGVLDARKCISYQTIERRSIIPDDEKSGLGDWLFGCDLCQEVCPWNRFSSADRIPAFPRNPSWMTLDCLKILAMTDEQFKIWFQDSSLLRTKRIGLQRNAAIVLGNTADHNALPTLEAAIAHPNAIVRDAVRWALEQIVSRSSH
jgi:epoxyqueuosine reductase